MWRHGTGAGSAQLPHVALQACCLFRLLGLLGAARMPCARLLCCRSMHPVQRADPQRAPCRNHSMCAEQPAQLWARPAPLPPQVPVYDFKVSRRVGCRSVKVPDSRVIIMEGIYALSDRLKWVRRQVQPQLQA